MRQLSVSLLMLLLCGCATEYRRALQHGDQFGQNDDWENATAAYEFAVALDPDSATATARLDHARTGAARQGLERCIEALNQNRIDDAVDEMAVVDRYRPNFDEATATRNALFQLFKDRAAKHARDGNVARAVAELDLLDHSVRFVPVHQARSEIEDLLLATVDQDLQNGREVRAGTILAGLLSAGPRDERAVLAKILEVRRAIGNSARARGMDRFMAGKVGAAFVDMAIAYELSGNEADRVARDEARRMLLQTHRVSLALTAGDAATKTLAAEVLTDLLRRHDLTEAGAAPDITISISTLSSKCVTEPRAGLGVAESARQLGADLEQELKRVRDLASRAENATGDELAAIEKELAAARTALTGIGASGSTTLETSPSRTCDATLKVSHGSDQRTLVSTTLVVQQSDGTFLETEEAQKARVARELRSDLIDWISVRVTREFGDRLDEIPTKKMAPDTLSDTVIAVCNLRPKLCTASVRQTLGDHLKSNHPGFEVLGSVAALFR